MSEHFRPFFGQFELSQIAWISFLRNPHQIGRPSVRLRRPQEVNMHFVYEGFTQNGYRRNFSFVGVNDREPQMQFLIEIDLEMFVKNGVSVQEGPLFCQELLTKAMAVGVVSLEKLQKYTVVCEDLRPILVEREKREAEKEMKRRYRSAYRKPPVSSNLVLGHGQTPGRNAI